MIAWFMRTFGKKYTQDIIDQTVIFCAEICATKSDEQRIVYESLYPLVTDPDHSMGLMKHIAWSSQAERDSNEIRNLRGKNFWIS
jgi:hypothetical protein